MNSNDKQKTITQQCNVNTSDANTRTSALKNLDYFANNMSLKLISDNTRLSKITPKNLNTQCTGKI